MTTEILNLSEIIASQGSKEVTHNTALRQLEAQLLRVISMTTTAEPGAPADGDTYILPIGATGTYWAGHDEHIAHYYSGAWKFYVPKEGYRLWVNDIDKIAYYPAVSGEGWKTATLIDIDLSSPAVPSDGDTLIYDASEGVWHAGPALGSTSLGDLADVDLASPSMPGEGYVLFYDATEGQWYSRQIYLADIADIDLVSPVPPADGYVLKYDATEGMWYPAPDSGGAGSTTLSALTDVDLVSPDVPNHEDVLTYDSAESKWHAAPARYLLTAIKGLTISNNSIDSDHDLDLAVGYALSDDATNPVLLRVTTALSAVPMDTTFAEGNGGGFASGESLPTSGTIHIWLIGKTDGTIKLFGNNNASSGLAPTLPSGYVYKRRIASLFTDSSANIYGITQNGNEFLLKVPINVLNFGGDPGILANLVTVISPAGLKLNALISFLLVDQSATDATGIFVDSPDTTDTAPTSNFNTLYKPGLGASLVSSVSAYLDRRTNTTSQIRYRLENSQADFIVRVTSFGWIDVRELV